jgi:hypothetical protein
MRTDIQTRFRTVRHGKLWPQTVFRSNFVTRNTTNNQAIQCTMTNFSDTLWPYQTPNTPCTLTTTPHQARYRGQRYRNSNFAYSSLRVYFITETLSFCREHESPWTLCCTPKQQIPAGHGKTNRNTTIKFDFALQSARERRARNLPLPPPPLCYD